MKKLVLFGAGKIGRSFIGQLFSKSGYEVVFIDINKDVVDELNRRKEYKVIIKCDEQEEILVKNVRAVMGTDVESVVTELSSADLAAVSVGQKGLPHILPVIAKALVLRNQPLDVIIAENMRNADAYITAELKKLLSNDFQLDKMLGVVETSIGKMVPIMPLEEEKNDVLLVFAEPYNSLIVDKKGFKNLVPDVEGLAPKENIKAWVDRKSFIHNYGHAVLAYVANQYNSHYQYTFEALENNGIKKFVRKAMLEAAEILMKKYPGEFTIEQLIAHIDDLIYRFENKHLGDTIFRVGCDLKRKLSVNDRVVGLLMAGIKYSMPIENVLITLACALNFRVEKQFGELQSDIDFLSELEQKGIDYILTEYCGIPSSEKHLIDNIKAFHKKIPIIMKDQIN